MLCLTMTSARVYVMYNECFGGFLLSKAAMEEYRRLLPEEQEVCKRSVWRNDQVMVKTVQKMGKKENRQYAKIQLLKIPVEYMDYEIAKYDGNKHVIIQHDSFKVDAVT